MVPLPSARLVSLSISTDFVETRQLIYSPYLINPPMSLFNLSYIVIIKWDEYISFLRSLDLL